ncbi:MAG: XdhC family protein [Filomicrobium sp.]
MNKENDTHATRTLDIWANARDWLEQGRAIGMATVIDTWGSSPVAVGSQMVIAGEEEFQGSVSGGCIEADVIVAALEVVDKRTPKRLSFGIANETAWASGLPCGGNIEIYVEPLQGPADLACADAVLTARNERRMLLITTDLDSGTRTLQESNESLDSELASLFKSGRSGLVSRADGDVFAHAHTPSPRLYIVGATHIAQALVSIADILGLTPIIIDPRDSFASSARFTHKQLIKAWPKEALHELGLDPFTAVIALAHVAHIDDDALGPALKSSTRYVGALGSKRNHAKRRARLLEAGHANEAIDRIHCPIGLDIGAVTPEEIALAIASEVVLAFRGPKRGEPGAR